MLHQLYASPLTYASRSVRALPVPRPAPIKYLLDPLAFFVALIGAPLLVAALGFWAFLIPVAAVVIGGLPYLIIGAPLLLYYVPRYGHEPGKIGALAALCVLVIAAGCAGYALLFDQFETALMLFLPTGFCLVFAALWGSMFGWLYGKLEREFYKLARL